MTKKVVAAVTFYMVTSLSLVLFNKVTFKNLDLPFPLLVTWIQFVITELLIFLGVTLRKRVPSESFDKVDTRWKFGTARKLVPVALCFVSNVVMSNLCLNFVEMTYFQVARCTTILWSLLFSRQRLNMKTTMACIVIVLGFVLGSIGEVNFDLNGVIAGVLSSILLALYSTLLSEHLSIFPSQMTLLFYNNTISIFLLFPFVLPSLLQIFYLNWLQTSILLLGGIGGFLINIAVYYQIKYTSALTSTVSGTVKACLQTLLGWIVFQNEVSLLNLVGIVMVILGSTAYSILRQRRNSTVPVRPVGGPPPASVVAPN